jgi:hypothetical protein
MRSQSTFFWSVALMDLISISESNQPNIKVKKGLIVALVFWGKVILIQTVT